MTVFPLGCVAAGAGYSVLCGRLRRNAGTTCQGRRTRGRPGRRSAAGALHAHTECQPHVPLHANCIVLLDRGPHPARQRSRSGRRCRRRSHVRPIQVLASAASLRMKRSSFGCERKGAKEDEEQDVRRMRRFKSKTLCARSVRWAHPARKIVALPFQGVADAGATGMPETVESEGLPS